MYYVWVAVFRAEIYSTQITGAPFTSEPSTSTETSVATAVTPGGVNS